MRYLTASVPKVSTRILLSAFLAALFALLLMLPASGQSTFDRTDGRISSGGLSVGVFDDIEDAQLIKNTSSPYTDSEGQTTTVYLPITNPGDYLVPQNSVGSVLADHTAFLADPQGSPQQTFFGDTLWASNDPEAYNTILVTAESNLVTPTAEGCAVATVRGGRASTPISVQMALTADTGGTTYYQAFVRILDPRAEDTNGDLVHTLSSDGPACTAYATGGSGVSQDATAFILARHGDRIAINVPGAGEVSVEVDGEGPDLLDIRPEDLTHLPSRSLDFSFTVRDNEAGLRHDGELVVTADGDYTEINEDGDHFTSGEPLSVFSGGQITLNGDAAEIDLQVWGKDTDVNTAQDITGAGAWTLVGNRPGVAYSFLAETNDYAEGAYFMEITAYDRVGNKTVSDALDKEGADTYLFTVDDTDPAHVEAWTGIAYEMNVLGGLEVADRSWIMVELNEAVRRGVNPEYIRVAGHEVVSVFQPDEAPDPDRDVTGRGDGSLIGTQRQTFAPPAPRAATSLAPAMQNSCGNGTAGTAITDFRFTYDRTTGDMTISWDRHAEDSEGYRLGMVLGGTSLAVIDLAEGSCSVSIPRASGVGRAIEAAFGGSDDLYMRIEIQPAAGDSLGSKLVDREVGLGSFTVPSELGAVSGTVVAPFVLHPDTPPVQGLPSPPETDVSVTCDFAVDSGRIVRLAWLHGSPSPPTGWTHVLYYQQLTYPGTIGQQGDHFEPFEPSRAGTKTGTVYGGYFGTGEYTAQGTVVAIYENSDGRRVASAPTTVECTAQPDDEPPVVESAVVVEATLTLTFSEPLDTDHEPAESAFAVTVAGSSRTVSSVDMNGKAVDLTLSSAVTPGDAVSVQYTPPTTVADRLQDYFENEVAAFTRTVTNSTSDTTAPRLTHAEVDGATLTLTYDEDLDTTSTPVPGAYTVWVGARESTVTVKVNVRTVVLTLLPAAGSEEKVTAAYTRPATNPVQDVAGNDADSFSTIAQEDTTAPALDSNNPPFVNGPTLTLTYNEELAGYPVPAGTAYTILVTDSQTVGSQTATNVVVNGRTVTLTFDPAIEYGDTVTLSYNQPARRAVQDTSENKAADFTDQSVANQTPDTTAPVFQSAALNGALLTLTYNEPLDTTSKPAASAFNVQVAGQRRTVNSVSVRNKYVDLTLASAPLNTESVTLSYTNPGASNNPIQDVAGNDAANLTNETVQDDTTKPALDNLPFADGSTLTLTYDENLDSGHVPGGTAYTVLVNGSPRTPASVDVSGETVTLTFADEIEHGDNVTLNYNQPAAESAVQDASENRADGFTGQTVDNRTPDTTPPVFQFATVDGSTLTMAYNEELEGGSDPVAGAFAVTIEGTAATATGVDVVGGTATVVLTISPPAGWREEVTVSYTKPGTGAVIEDLALNDAADLPATDVQNDTPSPDQTAPVLVSRNVDQDVLTLEYNEELDSTSVPGSSAYTVTVGGSSVTIDGVGVTGKVVTLTLGTAAVHGDTVTVAYEVPSSNPVRDRYENNAAAFSAVGVTNNTEFVDTRPPELVGASVNRATLILTFDETLKNSTPVASAFTVKVDDDATTHSVSTVSVSGANVRLVLDKSVERVNEVKVSYAKPTTGSVIEDDADTPNAAEGFTDYEVTNNTPWDTVPPRVSSAFVNGNKLTLNYNEALDKRSAPAASAYTVDVNDVTTTHTVSKVSVYTVSVVLTLSQPVAPGDIVKISYVVPASSPVQDIYRNAAGGLTRYGVTNNTTSSAPVVEPRNERLSHEDALKQQGYWPEDINGKVILDTRTRIYIELARELRADETPEVTLFGGVIQDLAGNANATVAITPRDGIAPRFTITVTATAQDRPIANARGEFTVEVHADEDLRRRPVVYFTDIESMKDVDDEYDYSIGDGLQAGAALIAQEDAQHWAGTYQASGLNAFDGLFGLVVYGFDYEDNIGESGGWTPPRHQRTPEIGPPSASRGEKQEPDSLDLTKMDEAGALLEIDRQFNGGAAPEHAVAPSRRMRNDQTESLNPFVSIHFPMEADEYAVCPTNGCGDPNPDARFSDSHARVDITAITLNDRNALSMLSRVSAGRFALVTSDLELGSYEIEYMAVDDAGNVDTFEFEFSVLEREPYELDVLPGWNLISFPGKPEDPSLGGVIPSSARVSPVLAYQDGDWLTAVVNSEGEWAGNLTQFEAGFGYWLFTTTYATLSPVIRDLELTDTPPSVRVKHGWNLLGVIDVFQNPAGTPPGQTTEDDTGATVIGDAEADNYFGSIPWRIAYGYDTLHSLWVRNVPGADRPAPEGTSADERGFRLVDGEVVTQEILNGKGYWVWSAEPGTLVP